MMGKLADGKEGKFCYKYGRQARLQAVECGAAVI